LVELVRALGYELVLIRREAVPMVQSLTRNRGRDTQEEQPLYAPDEEEGSS
jgi:hypothetical protein